MRTVYFWRTISPHFSSVDFSAAPSLQCTCGTLVPYSWKPVINNKKPGDLFKIKLLKATSKALIPAFSPFTGVSTASCSVPWSAKNLTDEKSGLRAGVKGKLVYTMAGDVYYARLFTINATLLNGVRYNIYF
jgi:hypothetical protein